MRTKIKKDKKLVSNTIKMLAAVVWKMDAANKGGGIRTLWQTYCSGMA